MSIGNLKDSGNQGNNFPWQYNVLKGLQCICDEVKAINIDTDDLEQLLADLIAELQAGIDVTIVNPLGQQPMADSVSVVIASDQAGVARTPGIIRATGAGTIAPLVYDFSVSNVGAANGTILGQTIKPGETLNFGAGAVNNYYAASTITYNGTGTELVIIYNA